MSKRFSAGAVILLLLCLLLSLCPPSFAEETAVIHIRTAEDLLALAKDCSLDTWSTGRRVVLDNDLSLSGSAFDSIPTFNGSFDGQGHTIYDMELTSAQSPCGFFLETGKDADIHDLHVSGSVTTHGDDSMVGGLVGLNRGMLTGCSFSGVVSALTQVGGIAGKNDASGIIVSCSASGTVRGLTKTGGIAGENAGALTGCENRSFVNTESVDPALRLESIDTSSLLNFIRSLRTDSAGITTDTGGVAGCSGGFIERCSNTGAVGYLHLGYNVGGIAGRSGGYINACLNIGDVYGRKDVGGIVGQAEPLTETAAQDLLAGVGYRIYALNNSVRDAVVDAQYASDDLSASISNLSSYLAPVSDAVSGLDITDPESAVYLHDVITDCVWNISNEMAAISQSVNGNSGILRDDFKAITENLNALSDTALQTAGVIATVDQPEDVLVDGSEASEKEDLTLGKTASCENRGSVNGDSNVGGIAGSLSLENELDPESELNLGGSRISKRSVSLSIVVTECVNHGAVTAKRECAGGIAGMMEMGLASHCASYGPVSLEDGDYAGGIAGLLYGSVKSSCAKCRLSGRRYIGGVVGNGCSARSKDERASTVSACYTLAEILGTPQFAGAISGGGDGNYENNYFVPAGFAGLDRLSIHGRAEPISFDAFAGVEGLPEECRTFILRFVVDGETVKEIPFAYGASFDRSVFPQVPGRDGRYAVWDRTELQDLRFDTTVTAEYRLDETVLRSENVREDGRAVLYVDGQFQQGDTVTLEQIPVGGEDIRAFSSTWQETVRDQLRSIFREHDPDYSIPVAVAEHLRVRFPDDGQRSHTLRYLAPDGKTENYRLYLAGEDGARRIRPETFGSYYLIEISGTEAEIALVSTIQSWWIVAYIAAALVILALLIFLIVKLRRLLRSRPKKARVPLSERPVFRWVRAHRKPLLILLPILVIVGTGIGLSLRSGSIGSAVTAYRVLRDFSGQECDVRTDVRLQIEDRDLEMHATAHRVQHDGHVIRCTEQYGIPLYISDGMVCLENGRVFRLADGQLSQGRVLDLALDIFLHERLTMTEADGVTRYEADIGGETAGSILQIFLSSDSREPLHADSMTVSLSARGGELQALSFSGGGSAADGKTFRFDVHLTPTAMTERPVIPPAVLDAIENGGGENIQVLSEDLLRLLAAWIKNDSAETVSAGINVSADCGSLRLTPRYRYSRRSVDGTDVHCIKSALFTLYFTGSAACTADGAELNEAQQRVVDMAQLIPLAKELCLKGQFDCTGAGDRFVYTVTLPSEDAADLVARLLPELDRLNLSYGDCRLRVTVAGESLNEIALDCGASLRVVSRDVDASVKVTAAFNGDAPEAVPPAVRAALVKET